MNSIIDASLDLNPVLEGLVRATLILVLACVADLFLRSKNPRWRVLLSRATVISLLALPCIVLIAPAWDFHILPRAESETLGSGNEPVTAAAFGPIPSRPIGPHTKDAMPTAGVGRSPSEATTFLRTLGLLCASVGVALSLGSILRYLLTLRRARRGEPAPQAIRDLSGRIAHDLGLSVAPEVFLDASSRVPYVIGCLRQVMVLPSHMTSKTYAADLPSILTHELVHIQQRDTLWIPLVHVLKHTFWFHPLAWRLQHAHAEACEAVCDARAAQYVGGAEQYGSCLARVALEVAGLRWRDAMSVPMIRRSQITRRLRDLSRGVGAASLTRGRVWMAILLAGALVVPLINVKIVRAQDPSTEPDTGRDEAVEIVAAVTPNPSRDRVTFYEDILPILTRNCIGCHPGIPLTTYQEVRPWAGRIDQFARDEQRYLGHTEIGGPLSPLTESDRQTIHQWMRAHAPRETPEGQNVSFEIDVRPIIARECLSCHSRRPIGMSFATYKEARSWGKAIRRVADSNDLYSVHTDRGLLSEFLDSSDVEAIRAWVRAGAPEGLETRFYELSEEELLSLFPATREEVRLSRDLEKSFIIEQHQMPGPLQELMPDIREPVTDQAISSIAYNPLTEQLVIHHTPSALREFEGQMRLLERGFVDFSQSSEQEPETQ